MSETEAKAPGIRIISRAHDGFRRGGVAHPADATYPADHFTAEQLKVIRAEPMLTVIVEPGVVLPVDPGQAEKLAAIVPTLRVGDFTKSGGLTAEAKRRLSAEHGIVPDEAELRTAFEAYARTQAGEG